jgi:stearoyl-CoA desaturase (delta-9 desaturase)
MDVTTIAIQRPRRRARDVYLRPSTIPFWSIHAAAIIGVIALGWSWSGFALAMAFYYGRMFFVTGAYHRYFSHRTYKTSRPMQFVLAFLAQTSAQKGALWWAANHRHHHRYSDQPEDVHSVVQDGFWWSHVGWILARDFQDTDLKRISDMAKYPELRLLDRAYGLVPAIMLAVVLFLVGGAHALIWGFFVSTVMLWHGTFTINSLSHVFGSKRYPTTDESRNNLALALLTMGEGWHNNHHYYQSATRNGFKWWEIDVTYYGLRLLALTGLIWDLREPPAHIVHGVPTAAPADADEIEDVRRAA